MNVSEDQHRDEGARPHPASDMQAHASDAAGLMKALGNESRLMVLCLLTEGEQSVSDLNDRIPLSQSALSQQLARLRQKGSLKRGASRRRFITRWRTVLPTGSSTCYTIFTAARARALKRWKRHEHGIWIRHRG